MRDSKCLQILYFPQAFNHRNLPTSVFTLNFRVESLRSAFFALNCLLPEAPFSRREASAKRNVQKFVRRGSLMHLEGRPRCPVKPENREEKENVFPERRETATVDGDRCVSASRQLVSFTFHIKPLGRLTFGWTSLERLKFDLDTAALEGRRYRRILGRDLCGSGDQERAISRSQPSATFVCFLHVHADDAMTLHWWMHWFWVTAQFLVILGNPVPSSTTEPRVESRPSPDPTPEVPTVDTETVEPRPSFRVAKAIGFNPATNAAMLLDKLPSTTISSLAESRGNVAATSADPVADDFRRNFGNATSPETAGPKTPSPDRTRNPVSKKDSKITWILTSNKTARSKYEQEERIEENGNRNGSVEIVEDLTVLPLQEEVSRIRLVLNKTKSSALLSASSSASLASSAGASGIRTFNRSDDDVEIDEELVEPQLFATAASILEVGVSESTRLSRARSAFPKDFQRDQVQGDHAPDYNDDENSKQESTSRSNVDIAAITGSCLATVVLLSTMGSLGFIMYRRRYLNPPQTLNSDKCSNPDSSGYIDDSTIRDNSEEMYSLDNDSFLNSLEAMTIQNYWTDSVKHTKL
ncbi:uncharacterized protein LOC116435159 isoform X1 [Nomia melanderi]|uniref:uncharacterized protein LOC116435159 isoform X1 n=1 Tax=Nomia melanderi TaxID=2448451 RepID=UPI003FCC55B2